MISYFFSLDAAAGAAAGAGAVDAAGALAPASAVAAGAALASPEAVGAGFADPYPSAYQPPPFSANAGAEMTRFSSPPQCGQVVISGSENFWIFSVCLRQTWHSYS
jgi:hypothetical protein